jgi:hypothetical protein
MIHEVLEGARNSALMGTVRSCLRMSRRRSITGVRTAEVVSAAWRFPAQGLSGRLVITQRARGCTRAGVRVRFVAANSQHNWTLCHDEGERRCAAAGLARGSYPPLKCPASHAASANT